ncbi:hypothetical protein IGI04_036119 [Brassica rapa subsp. trilocularis]|uniref:Uncharacterized protein n=1 Tax=Brassica rapa subsp. trilocularis TaxID=1813537 RepID=A0ABQ7LDK0_BRACM|nr:hypothetical protein IGI04_036119 [Brassica rapa subsp. trilocularis]
MLQGFSLSPAFEKRYCLTTDVRSKNCCSWLDANNLIFDRRIRNEDVLYSSKSFLTNFSLDAAYYGFFERILMTHSFLERICQPEVDLANHREESAPFNVHDATSILDFSSSQMFSMLFRDLLGTTETERNDLPEKASILWLIVEFQFDIVYEYSIRTYSPFLYERKRLNRYFEGLCTFLLLMFGMIDNSGRFIDDAWIVIWLFPRSELDMRGDRFSTFGEFRSVCKIWMNNYGTIYRDRKNRLKLSSLDYPPRFYVQRNRIVKAAKVLISMVTSIEAKLETFRSRFESERKDGGRYVATDGLTGRYVASGSKPRRVLLAFVVKSQRKLRLRRNEKRFDEDSKENPKEDLSEALQGATSLRSEWKQAKKSPTCFRRKISTETPIETKRKAVSMRIQKRTQRRTFLRTYRSLRRYVASGSKPRRILLVFVVKSQRKIRLRRNEKRFDENSKENPKEDLSEALQGAIDRAVFVLGRYVATEQCVCSVATDRAVCVLGRYVATEQRVRVRSLRSDQAVCVLGCYVATEPCACSVATDRAVCVLGRYVATKLFNRFVVFPFSAINVGVFQRFFWENKFYPSEIFSETCFGKTLTHRYFFCSVMSQTYGVLIRFIVFLRVYREKSRVCFSALPVWKVATKFPILLKTTAFAHFVATSKSNLLPPPLLPALLLAPNCGNRNSHCRFTLEKTVDLISNPRKSVAIITRDHKSFGCKGFESQLDNKRRKRYADYVPLSRIKPNVVQLIELDKRPNCLGECMPSGTRSNKEKDLLFSDDPAHLERTIRIGQRSTSLDATTSSSIDTHNQPSTDTRPSSSIDPNRSTTIDITPRTSIDTVSSKMVNVIILTQDDNGNLYDQDGHLRNATGQEIYAQGTGGNINFFGNGQRSNQSSQFQKPFNNSKSYSNSYCQNPPPQTQESKIEEMLDRTLGTQVRKFETQVIQTGETLKRQEAFAREAGADKGKHHLEEGDFEIESSMSLGGSQWCRPMSMNSHRSTDHDEDRWTDYSSHRSTTSAKSTKCNAVRILTHEEFAVKHPHPPSPFFDKIDRSVDPTIDRQSESDVDRHNTPPIDRQAPLTYRVGLPSIDNDYINALKPPPKPLDSPPEPKPNPLNKLGFIGACHCGAEYESENETEYSESIDTNTFPSIDSNESTVTDDRNNTSLDVDQPPPSKRGRDDYSIGSWADSGFHESFAVDTVITSPNEEHTEEYDEDYWKERAIEMSLEDERFETHKFTNMFSSSFDKVHSISVDTHPRPAKQPLTSIDTHTGTSIDIRTTAKIQEQENIPSPTRDPDGNARAIDGRMYGARKFTWERRDEDGVYRDECGHARGVAEPHLSSRTSHFLHTLTRLAPKLYTKDEINEMVTGICGAQEKLGEELKSLVEDTHQPLDRGYNELFRSMVEMRTEIESLRQQLEKEATTSASIDASHAPSIDVSLPTAQIPAEPQCSAEHKDEWEVSYINTRINDMYYPLNNNVDWLTTKIELLQ